MFISNKNNHHHLIEKWLYLYRNFSKENIQMGKGYMKVHLTSLVIKGMQIKIIMIYHLAPVRMAVIKKPRDNRFW